MLAGMDASILIATASLAGVVLLATVGLATLLVNVTRGIERRLTARMDGLDSRMDALTVSQGEIRERMAKLEGLLEGLREAVTGRRAA